MSDVEHDLAVATDSFKRRIALVVAASLVIDVIFSGLTYFTEKGAGDAFKTYWAALFFVTTQLLTVSSSLPNPERAWTKLIDVGLEAWGVLIIAAFAGIIGDLLHHRTRHRASLPH